MRHLARCGISPGYLVYKVTLKPGVVVAPVRDERGEQGVVGLADSFMFSMLGNADERGEQGVVGSAGSSGSAWL